MELWTDGGAEAARRKAREGETTRHCASGSLWRMYAWNGAELPEAALLGLGEGIGFIYWHQKGSPPMLGGRAMPERGMEALAAERTGVRLESSAPTSAVAARSKLAAALEASRPVMLQADMGFLPYFDFAGSGYHFGGHVVLACARDAAAGRVLVADRETTFHWVADEALDQARSSTFKPFPPKRRCWMGEFAGFRQPEASEIRASLAAMARPMLEPPISNMGCAGIAKASRLAARWPRDLDPAGLSAALFNLYIFASEVGGSGGGNFRHMAADYLAWAGGRLTPTHGGAPAAAGEASETFRAAARLWDEAAAIAHAAFEGEPAVMAAACASIADLLARIAELELQAWRLCLQA